MKSRHSLIVRLTHWLAAGAMICMILSGWQIYNASPLLAFAFPRAITLGGWLGGAISWHLSAMWVLMAAGLIYLINGALTGHFRRDLAPTSAREVVNEIGLAFRLKLAHTPGYYNAVQRLFYTGVLATAMLAVISGLAIWKPVQFAPLTALLGDYDIARKIHFSMMVIITGFLIIHLTLVAIVPRTLISMITGNREAHSR